MTCPRTLSSVYKCTQTWEQWYFTFVTINSCPGHLTQTCFVLITTVLVRKKLAHECPFASEVCLSAIQSFLLLKHVMSHLGKNRIKQGYESKKWQSLVLQLQQQSSYSACAVTRLAMMLARVILRSCWGFCTCVGMRKCDRTCLQTWTVTNIVSSIDFVECIKKSFPYSSFIF